jgi:hypothetical protein
MMQRLSLFRRVLLPHFLLLLMPAFMTAQTKQFTLNGSLGVESGETFSYRLVFTDSAGVIKGYAVTYQREENDTKATITGVLDKKKKTLSFTETEILYNRGFKSNAIICLIKATLKYIPEGGNFILSGPATSTDVGNGTCSRGSIRFEKEAELRELFREERVDTVRAPAARTVVVRSPQPPRPSAAVPVAPTAPEPEQVTAGKDKIYDWYSDTVALEIWDGGRIDGDIVTVLYNGHPVLTRYTLAKEKKRILLPLTGKAVDTVTIRAENTGNEPPNTAHLLLRDGETEHSVVAYNDPGREAVIRIRKVKTRDSGKASGGAQ